MSISLTDGQRSFSNPSIDPDQNPSSVHGLFSPHRRPGPIGPGIDGPSSAPFGSVQSYAEDPPSGSPGEISGPNYGCSQYASGTSGSVRNSQGSNSRTITAKKCDTYLQHQYFGEKGSFPKFRSNNVNPHPNESLSATIITPCDNHSPSDSNDIQSSAAQATSRRREVMNANHLLNFHYDPIPRSRHQQKIPASRRQQRIKTYNKDLFLQANYRFVIYDSGRYSVESIDPDKMFPWEDVVCVKYSSPSPVQCPICLENPLCPQITSCGHIFCFPCILRYLLMGVEERKSETWKKCPLCFSMISSKDLYTIKIDNVKQFCAGDHADFTLLARAKDSQIPLLKCQDSKKSFDLFSKIILSSDIELSVRDARTGLTDWLGKAETDTVDDLEKLPYVCTALDQLEERIRKWVDNHTLNENPPQPTHFTVSRSSKFIHSSNISNPGSFNSSVYKELVQLDTLADGSHETGELQKTLEFSENCTSFSEQIYHDENRLLKDSSSYKDLRERDSYTFYQAVDGQPLILHPLSMKCLLHHYGSYDMLPPRIGGAILELETITQSEATRKRYRYLSHFSLTTTFQLCELELGNILPPSSLAPFMDEIKKREKQRKQLVKKEQEEKARTEAAHCAEVAALRETLNPSNQRYLSSSDTIYSLDEFEALGIAVAPSTNPPTNTERMLFSNVTRLGYAAAHDSPSLRVEELASSSQSIPSSDSHGPKSPAMPSFANILSSTKSEQNAEMRKSAGTPKKGNKSNKVLLSTSGGRRY